MAMKNKMNNDKASEQDGFPEVTSLLKELQSLREQLAYNTELVRKYNEELIIKSKKLFEEQNTVRKLRDQLATEKLHVKELQGKIEDLLWGKSNL